MGVDKKGLKLKDENIERRAIPSMVFNGSSLEKMKMTMHINEEALSDVIKMFGCESKTEAVNFALKEVVRRKKLRACLKKGMGLTPDELRDGYETDYEPRAILRIADSG